MEEAFSRAVSNIALLIEVASALIIAAGSVEALYRTALSLVNRRSTLYHKKTIWTRYAMWLLLGLEFELAADIIRSAIAPTWSDIGQLGAIAAIRTFLNYFLERDIERSNTRQA
jgi:uncharacterized membrane protein